VSSPLTSSRVSIEDLQRRYRRLNVVDAQAQPRLEMVLDTAVGTYGLGLLTDALSDLAAASPNAHHAFFAGHLAAGGRHITANFDTRPVQCCVWCPAQPRHDLVGQVPEAAPAGRAWHRRSPSRCNRRAPEPERPHRPTPLELVLHRLRQTVDAVQQR
jgi:hypothetical protein